MLINDSEYIWCEDRFKWKIVNCLVLKVEFYLSNWCLVVKEKLVRINWKWFENMRILWIFFWIKLVCFDNVVDIGK